MRVFWLVGWLSLALPVAAAGASSQVEEAVRKAEVLEQVMAPDIEVTEAAEPIDEQEAQSVDPQGSDPLEEPLTCLARSIYWEAKGVPGHDMESVANVVMNRLADERFPNTICDAVKQGSEQPPCQFSWWCDGRPDEVVEGEVYEAAKEIARQAQNLRKASITCPTSVSQAWLAPGRLTSSNW
ncbi:MULTISPECIES: cell wall hydrolase [Halomonadaceae]|uniref:cell wall hydrolase n=1 Tax=Halomonadaceae TaxID=28256 RepID=UPI0015990B8E|nr:MULTISPECIES: cell wall hydrolase [Halomonas]QJQ95870.1 cell wall hydrolase [Halomonas sp. PA5]